MIGMVHVVPEQNSPGRSCWRSRPRRPGCPWWCGPRRAAPDRAGRHTTRRARGPCCARRRKACRRLDRCRTVPSRPSLFHPCRWFRPCPWFRPGPRRRSFQPCPSFRPCPQRRSFPPCRSFRRGLRRRQCRPIRSFAPIPSCQPRRRSNRLHPSSIRPIRCRPSHPSPIVPAAPVESPAVPAPPKSPPLPGVDDVPPLPVVPPVDGASGLVGVQLGAAVSPARATLNRMAEDAAARRVLELRESICICIIGPTPANLFEKFWLLLSPVSGRHDVGLHARQHAGGVGPSGHGRVARNVGRVSLEHAIFEIGRGPRAVAAPRVHCVDAPQ